jgi:hypothetical protein
MVVRLKHVAVNLKKIINNYWNSVVLDGNPSTRSNTSNRMQTTSLRIRKLAIKLQDYMVSRWWLVTFYGFLCIYLAVKSWEGPGPWVLGQKRVCSTFILAMLIQWVLVSKLLRDSFFISWWLPIAVAGRPKARTVFARSNTEIVGSNPTGGMDVCVLCAFTVCLHSLRWDSQPT